MDSWNIFRYKKAKLKLRRPSQTEIDSEQIKGIDLRIDNSVQHLCEVYNGSAGSTRSVLYVLLIINVLSLMSVINTFRNNWTISRISTKQREINISKKNKVGMQISYAENQKKIRDTYVLTKKTTKDLEKNNQKYQSDSSKLANKYAYEIETINDKINGAVTERDNLVRNRIENSQTVRVPLLGNSFDVNNLGIVSGISFISLLIVIRFTLIREKNNLRIALNAISERYNGTIEDNLETDIKKIIKNYSREKEKYITAVNFKRRRYHYNSLSMNEVFNIPELDVSNNSLQKTKIGQIAISYLYCVPFFIYCLVFGNDLSTLDKGYRVAPHFTIFSVILSFFFITYIARLCNNCNVQKRIIHNHFRSFFSDNEYHYNKNEFINVVGPDQQLSLIKRFLFAFYFLFSTLTDIGKIIFSKSSIVEL